MRQYRLYVDQTPRSIRSTYGSYDEFANTVCPNFDMVIIEVESQRDPDTGKYKRKWKHDDIMEFTDALGDMPIGLMWWPDSHNLDDIVDEIEEIGEWLTFTPVMDCEGRHGWGKVHQDDATRFGKILKDIGDFQMTCVLERYEKPNTRALRAFAKVASIQTYSRYSKDKPERSWGAKYGPGNFQLIAKKYMETSDVQAEMGVDLPTWSQQYPEHDVLETMTYTLDACEGVPYISYWSSKWLVRKTPGYAKEHSEKVREFFDAHMR